MSLVFPENLPSSSIHHDDAPTLSESSPSTTPPPPAPPIAYPNSTVAAIANFRPSPREIINGIAPHVFDDHRSFRRRRRPSRTPKPYWYTQSKGVKSSPLRVSAVVSLDDRSIYLEPSENDDTRDVIRRASEDVRSTQQQPLQVSMEVPRKLDKLKSPRRGFRIDIPLLKTFVIKLKPTNRNRH